MKTIAIVLTYTLAVSMLWILRHSDAYRSLYRQFPFYVPETFKHRLRDYP